MRRYGLIICTLVFMACLTSTAFQIDPPLPSTVVTGQGVPFTWIRDPKDPSEFSFRKIQLDDNGPSDPLQVDKDDAHQESGLFTLTFTNLSPFQVVAVDNHTKTTFFTAPGTIVAAQSTSSVTPSTPGANPSSGNSSTIGPDPSSTTSSASSTLTSTDSSSGSSTATPDTSSTGPSTTSTNNANSNTSIGNPTPASAPETDGPPTSTAPSQTVGGTSASSRNTKPIIIGSVIGGIVFILLLLLFLLLLIRRRRNKLSRNDSVGSDVFYRDKMVQAIGRRLSLTIHRKEYPVEEGITASPTTPLREDFDDRDVGSADGHDEVSALGSKIVESPATIETRSASGARTDRQMQIEQKIIELQSRLITASPSEKKELRERVERLTQLRDSDWASRRDGDGSDEVPEVMKG
ncbi:hypothetical protein E1B28_013115 [Marasmius oreades]|uniref:Uncharacterized protein n=1 Tax=Marasmius oreades TaxID=181124 RepID=A0A9P7RP87_9AGAR|nr:uncharacterized protein E1B28_013115 [Marasmius oreades]KAG7087135.1 hypothetical protein E1B28_013115 [Marasmius oreades]